MATACLQQLCQVCFRPHFNSRLIVLTVTVRVLNNTSQTSGSRQNCFRPQRFNNSFVTLNEYAPYGTVATYACRIGYRFASGGTVQSALCKDGRWINNVEDCQGKLKCYFKTFEIYQGYLRRPSGKNHTHWRSVNSILCCLH